MEQDIHDGYITTLLQHVDTAGCRVLEIGCGGGRITSSLSGRCRFLTAVDVDLARLHETAHRCRGPGVATLLVDPSSDLPFRPGSFDLIIYSLSLHHLPPVRMRPHLEQTSHLLTKGGSIAVIEPGDGGSFTSIKERFGVGSGDERKPREDALEAVRSLAGMERAEIPFQVVWRFSSVDDFLQNLVPPGHPLHGNLPPGLTETLKRHETDDGIFLDAGRLLILLKGAQ